MGSATERRGSAGLSLVELLVVLAMIGVLSAAVIPLAMRNGWFTPSKSAFAARELFTILKAARVYASTYNIETAVAYGGVLVQDSELSGTPCVPVADTVILARRLKREEMTEINQIAPGTFPDLATANVFVPLRSAEGVFRPLPKEMVVLPDLFAVEQPPSSADYASSTGLLGIQLYDVDSLAFLEPRADTCNDPPVNPDPRLDYTLDSLALSFPAHRFKPDGSMRVDDASPRQRLRFRVGARPDALFRDRFFANPDVEAPISATRDAVFHVGDSIAPSTIEIFVMDNGTPSDDSDDFYADIDADFELFVPTGRVRLLP